MILPYFLLNKIINKIKKLIIMLFAVSIVLILVSPYAVSFYVEKKYDNLIKFAHNLTPGIKITSHFNRKYFHSVLITKIQLANNAFFDYSGKNIANSLINYIPQNSIVLQHEILYTPHKKLIATINTTIVDGLPKFADQNKNIKLVTTIDFDGNIKSIIKGVNFNYALNPSENNYLETQSISMHIENDIKNLIVHFKVPKLIYTEHHNKTEMDNLNFNLTIKDFSNPNSRKIKLVTGLDRLYLIAKSQPILRLANLIMEQNLAEKLTNNLTFLILNILEHKFGPLATKWQLNNINLSTLIKNFNHIRLPITSEQMDSYKFIEIGNTFLKNQPNLSVDLLLNIGNEKLKVLSDVMVDTKNMDWFTKEDILDSLSANIAAKIPKEVLIELVTFLVQEKQKKEDQYYYSNKHNKHGINMAKSFASKDFKESPKQLDSLVLEKIAYLIKNNIIKEHEDSFSLDLSIAEGTFYSRMNPFKIFSF